MPDWSSLRTTRTLPAVANRRGWRTTENPGLYYGYSRTASASSSCSRSTGRRAPERFPGATSIGGDPRPFTLVELEAIVHERRSQVAEAVRQEGLDPARVPELDAALALGRLTGVPAACSD